MSGHGPGKPTASVAGAPCPGGHIRSLRTSDFDEWAAALQGWRLRPQQLGRGPFRGEAQFLHFGGVQIFRLAVNRTLLAQGSFPPNTFGYAPVVTVNEGAIWHRKHLKSGQVRVVAPGQDADHVTSADYQMVALMVEGNRFREWGALCCGFDPAERLAGRDAVTTDPASCRALWGHLVELLDRAAAQPDCFAQPELVRLIEEDCIRRFVGLIAQVSDGGRTERRTANREQLVRSAEEYMHANVAEPLFVLDLCRKLGVSERTLRYAFQEIRGLSPMAYFKAGRLNAVRLELKAANADASSVYEIARRWGFWHPGEFAADYRRLFGELPSQTLNADHR